MLDCPPKRPVEKLNHSRVVKQNPAQHRDMPNIVTSANVVECAREPPLRDTRGVDDRTGDIDTHALRDGGVEVETPLGAPCHVELDDGREARGGEGDVEGDAGPGHVCAVEGRVPGEDGAEDPQDGGQGHVDGAGDGFAVEGGPLRGQDTGRDEKGDACVVDTGEALEQGLVGDAVHGVPHGGADETFAGGAEEDGGDEDVGFGAQGEGGGGGVEVEGDGEDDDEADGVGPDVDGFVGRFEDGRYAFGLGFGEAIASDDVWVDPPGVW